MAGVLHGFLTVWPGIHHVEVLTFIPVDHGTKGGSTMNRTQKLILAIAVAGVVSIPCWLAVATPTWEKTPMDCYSQVESVGTERASENSRLIAELQRRVDMLDRRVNEALERAAYRMTMLTFVPVVVTAYNSIPTQTDSTPEITASNKRVSLGIVALSRDIEMEFGFRLGDPVFIVGLGFFVFEDRMHKRWARRVDILMSSRRAAKEFGVKHSFLVIAES
jgi:3D (Asp-Asp-Asp) domain-containing protein